MFGNLYGRIALFYHTQRKMEKAGKYYEKGLANGMEDPQYLSACSIYLMRLGEFERAHDMLAALYPRADVKPKARPNVKYNYSIALWKCGKVQEAIAHMEELITRGGNATYYSLLGHLYNIDGDLERALQRNAEFLQYDEDDGELLDNLCNTYILRREWVPARVHAEKALSHRAEMVDANYHMAQIEQHEGKMDEAITRLEKLLDKNYTPLMTVSKQDVEALLTQLKAGQTDA